MVEGEKGTARPSVDPSAADPGAAAQEIAEREGIPFETALADRVASIAKRKTAVRRIRAIREEGAVRIAAMRATTETDQDGYGE